jgi:hypothetical protein
MKTIAIPLNEYFLQYQKHNGKKVLDRSSESIFESMLYLLLKILYQASLVILAIVFIVVFCGFCLPLLAVRYIFKTLKTKNLNYLYHNFRKDYPYISENSRSILEEWLDKATIFFTKWNEASDVNIYYLCEVLCKNNFRIILYYSASFKHTILKKYSKTRIYKMKEKLSISHILEVTDEVDIKDQLGALGYEKSIIHKEFDYGMIISSANRFLDKATPYLKRTCCYTYSSEFIPDLIENIIILKNAKSKHHFFDLMVENYFFNQFLQELILLDERKIIERFEKDFDNWKRYDLNDTEYKKTSKEYELQLEIQTTLIEKYFESIRMNGHTRMTIHKVLIHNYNTITICPNEIDLGLKIEFTTQRILNIELNYNLESSEFDKNISIDFTNEEEDFYLFLFMKGIRSKAVCGRHLEDRIEVKKDYVDEEDF